MPARLVLVDSSAWIEHCRQTLKKLVLLLGENQVVIHSAVIGELACGNLPHRDKVIAGLKQLPRAREAEENQALLFLDRHGLYSTGLG